MFNHWLSLAFQALQVFSRVLEIQVALSTDGRGPMALVDLFATNSDS